MPGGSLESPSRQNGPGGPPITEPPSLDFLQTMSSVVQTCVIYSFDSLADVTLPGSRDFFVL